jgi:SAM-dependent methyltransferase
VTNTTPEPISFIRKIKCLSKLADRVSVYTSVLDIGCGKGEFLRALSCPVKVGVDICQGALETAHTNCVANSTPPVFVQADLSELEIMFRPKSFDAVVGLDIVEHFEAEAAKRLLFTGELLAKKFVAWLIPIGDNPQADDPWDMDNAVYNTHRSTWWPEDLRKLGYTVLERRPFNRRRGIDAMLCTKGL